MKGPIQAVEVSYLGHATEDLEKVKNAVLGVVGVGAEPLVEELEGHFGNRITKVVFHVTGDEANSAFSALVEKMPASMRSELAGDLGDVLDEHFALYLRLDKQALIAGRLAFAQTDPVRVRVKPRLFMMKGGGNEFYRKVLGGGR